MNTSIVENSNDIVFESANPENIREYVLRHGETKRVMESKLEESNNNSVECIIEGVKNMGNVSKSLSQCVEDCAGGSDVQNETSEKTNEENKIETDEVEYESEEFDEYKEEEEFTKKLESMLASPTKKTQPVKHVVIKHPKSATSVVSLPRSKSRSSVASSSSVVSRHPKLNMSFTNDRMKQIERENGILLKKILNAKSDRRTNPDPPLRKKQCNSSISRKRQQERIQHDNLIILKKIQRAKSSNCSSVR